MAISHSPRVARAVITIGQELGATDEEIMGALAGGLVESNLRNLNYGDRDSLGAFQQRKSIYGNLTLEEQIRAFYSGAKAVTGEWKKGLLETRDMGGSIGQRVQAVQVSAFPEKYDEQLDEAQRLFARYDGDVDNDPDADPDDAAPDAGDVDDDFDVDAALIPLFANVSDAIRRGQIDQDDSGLAGFLGGAEGDGIEFPTGTTGAQAEALRGQVAGTAQFRYADMPALTLANGTKLEAPGQSAAPALTPGDQSGSTSSSLAWGGYDNGKIPTSALMRIGGMHYSGRGAHYFAPDAGAAMKQMRRDARRQGVSIKLTDSYRSYAAQVDVYNRKKGVVAVADPGTSIHGFGKAVDVAGDEARRWIQQNGYKYGWVWPDWARSGDSYEPWHFEFRPS